MRRLQLLFTGVTAFMLLSPALFAQTCVSNRNDVWDWTIQVSQALYLNGPSGVVTRAVNLPYYSTDDDTVNLNLATGADVQPSDGWALLYRSFGNSSCGVNMPYFILYNRYNGLLRLFYHDDVSSNTFTSGKVLLSEISGGTAAVTAAPMLSFDGGDINDPLITLNKVTPGFWSYADFSLATYDPAPVADATLKFAVNGVTTQSLTISGGISLDQVEQASHAAGTIDPVGAVKAADSNYRTLIDARNDLQKAHDTAGNAGAWWLPAVGLLASGANLFSGVAAVAGFIQAFHGGGKSQTPAMHFQGQTSLTGQITSEASLGEIIMRVPGAPHSNPNDDALPFSDVPLGVFKATIPLVNSFFQRGTCLQITCIVNNGKVYQSASPLIVQFNPNALSGATTYVSWGWTFLSDGPSFSDEVLVTGTTVTFNLSGRFTADPSGVAIKIRTVPSSAPTGQDPVVVMKVFPAAISFLGTR